MKIVRTNLSFVSEPLMAPFGFKGSSSSELWQVIAKVESDKAYGVGVSIQSVLWADATVFKSSSVCGGNARMLLLAEYGLKLLEGKEFVNPVEAINYIEDKVFEYGKLITQNPNLKKTFALNALVCVDNALWQLYGREKGTEDLLSIIDDDYTKALSYKQEKLCNIPLITYGVSIEDVVRIAKAGCACLKIKIGSDPDKDGPMKKMLEWDKERMSEIHTALKDIHTPHTKSGNIMYYLDANGRYDTVDRLIELLDHIDSIGALDRILILEEPFDEDNKIDVSSLPVRVAADESAHSVADVKERIALGYGAIALKPIAKTFSVTLQMLSVAHENGIPCFCADLTVNPVTREFNKFVASRIAAFPGMKIGMMESNGAQNYTNWESMLTYHPLYGKTDLIEPENGIFTLDGYLYKVSGGIFKSSDYYEKIAKGDII